MKIRTLVQATPTGKAGDVHDAEIDTASGTAWVLADFGGFRLKPHEFEVVPDAPGSGGLESVEPRYDNCSVCNAGIPLGTSMCDACLEVNVLASD